MGRVMSFPQSWSQFVLVVKDQAEASALLKEALESSTDYKFGGWSGEDDEYVVLTNPNGKNEVQDDMYLVSSRTDALLIIETIDDEGQIRLWNYLLAKRIADLASGEKT